MPKLFIGSFLVGAEAERISSITRATAEQFSSGYPRQDNQFRIRALPKEKLHITWLFLGAVSRDLVEELTRKFAATLVQLKNKLSRGAFEITYDHLSLWPSADNARVAVLLPAMPPPEVAMINLELKAALSGFQENEEVYPQFNPHVTLFRISPASNLCATNLLQALSNPAHVLNEQPILPVKQAISIDNIRLIESNDGYTVI